MVRNVRLFSVRLFESRMQNHNQQHALDQIGNKENVFTEDRAIGAIEHVMDIIVEPQSHRLVEQPQLGKTRSRTREQQLHRTDISDHGATAVKRKTIKFDLFKANSDNVAIFITHV